MMWFLLLAGCTAFDEWKCDQLDLCDPVPPPDVATDTAGPAPSDTDTDTDTDTDCTPETGIAEVAVVGRIQTSEDTFVDAVGEYVLTSLSDAELCRLGGTLAWEGDAPDGCPNCTWAFDLAGITGSTAEGDTCAALGLTDGAADGYLDYAWGYAPVYYYDYNGTPIPLEASLFLYVDGGWTRLDTFGGDGSDARADLTRQVYGGGYAFRYYDRCE